MLLMQRFFCLKFIKFHALSSKSKQLQNVNNFLLKHYDAMIVLAL